MRRLLASLLLFLALPAGAATRLYFGRPSADTVLFPAPDAGWEQTGDFQRSVMHIGTPLRARGLTTATNIALGSSNSDQELDVQYTMALAPGVTFTAGVTTVKAIIRMSEEQSDDDVTQCILGIRVVARDGTVRATLLPVANYGTTTELFTNFSDHRAKICADGDTVQATYAAVEDDFLVVETGYATDGATGATVRASQLATNASGYEAFLSLTSGDCPEGEESSPNCTSWIEFSNTITNPTDAVPGPTRVYFPSSGAAAFSLAAMTDWNVADETQNFRLVIGTKGSTAIDEGQVVDINAGSQQRENDRVFISDPLEGGIVFKRGVTTVRGTILGREFDLTDNVAGAAFAVRIVSNDGTVTRGKLIPFPLPIGHRRMATSGSPYTPSPLTLGTTAVVSTIETVTGDRLVVETGFSMLSGTSTTPQAALVYGEAADDCDLDTSTLTSPWNTVANPPACTGWLEFSNLITTTTAGPGARRVMLSSLLDPKLLASPRTLLAALMGWLP